MLIQDKLNEAELILKTILEDEAVTSREYLKALVVTYFKTQTDLPIKFIKNSNCKKKDVVNFGTGDQDNYNSKLGYYYQD